MKETQHPPLIDDTQETQQTEPNNLEAYLRDAIFGADFRKYNDQLENLTIELENVQHKYRISKHNTEIYRTTSCFM